MASTSASAPLLTLDKLGAGFGERVVLVDIDLELPPTGMTVIMGPSSVGKSTLLRLICGVAQQSANLKWWGEMRYGGLLAGERGWPSLVGQDARLLVATVRENLLAGLPGRSEKTPSEQIRILREKLDEFNAGDLLERLDEAVIELKLVDQRRVAILRQMLSDPGLLCADEPCTGLDEQDVNPLMALLRCCARKRAVLLASHHQRSTRRHADRVVLLASGRIQEDAPVDEFFARPRSNAAREFIDRGTCDSVSPDATPEMLDESATTPPPLPESARTAMSAWAGPRGFVWLEKGRLAGTPKPGAVSELEHDLAALKRVGITRLITLLEYPLENQEELRRYGLRAWHSPIDDMAAPEIRQAVEICNRIDIWLEAGHGVALHCLAGHGRTGTLLAAYRVWRGASAID
ncbi:MAG: ATP-binding cassette domain-containing protein, partial [Wenzhouxiangellaceae bacterium]